jgi:hypothetical protein
MRTTHYDRSTLMLDRPVVVDGGLMVEGVAARVHTPLDPLPYPTGPEMRRADEVKRVIDQLPSVPVTMPHGGKVVGKVTRAWMDDGRAAVRMYITDAAAIAAIKSRTSKELSIGYSTDVVDGYQTNITLTELSIVTDARCGSTCSIKTDHSHAPAGVIMDPELVAVATQLNIRTDGVDARTAALAVLRAVGTDINSATSNGEPITSRDDTYVTWRAIYAAQGVERSRADAAVAQSFATVQRTDCGGCKGTPNAHVDLEIAARERMKRDSRLAYAESVGRVDEAAAIDAIASNAKPIVRPAPKRVDSTITDEATARAAMHAASRNAFMQPSPNPLVDEGAE